MIRDLLKSMIKTGVNKETDDTKPIRRAIVKWLGIEQQVESLVPFGTFGNPQEGTQYVLLKRRCNEANVAGIACDPVNRIKKECKPGEYGVGNPITRANIYFKENGDISIETPEGNYEVSVEKGAMSISASDVVSIDGSEVNLNSGTSGVARVNDPVTTTLNQVDLAAIGAQFAGLFLPQPTPIPPAGVVAITGTNKILSGSTKVKAG